MDSICCHDIPQRLFAFSGPTHHRQADSSLVWRLSSGLGNLPLVLPGRSAPWVPLRTLSRAAIALPAPSAPALGGAGSEPSRVAHPASGLLEAFWTRTPCVEYFVALGCDHRSPLRCFVQHQPPAAGMVRAERWRARYCPVPGRAGALTLPAVRSLQCRLHAGSTRLPHVGRAILPQTTPGHRLVGSLRWRVLLVRVVRAGRISQGPRGDNLNPSCTCTRTRLDSAIALGRSGGMCIVLAARRHRPPHRERGGHSLPMGAPTRALFAELHPVF